MPRELSLYTQDGEIYLSAVPVPEIKTLRKEKKEIPAFTVANDYHIDSLLADNDGAYELALEITVGEAEIMGFNLFNDKGEKVDIYFNLPEKRLVMDRTKSGIVDLSLAPTPAIGDSVADILCEIGLEYAGAPGTTAALAMLNDQVKKGGVMASSHVGGLSGAFIPVSEDAGMIAAAKSGALSITKLEAMTAVCSVGLDMIVVPGDTTAEVLSAVWAVHLPASAQPIPGCPLQKATFRLPFRT